MGQHKQRQEIAKWQQRKKDIDEAIPKRTLPRVPVEPSDYVAPAAALQHRTPAASDDVFNDLPQLEYYNDESAVASVTDSEADTEQSDNDNIDFCELCHKPAWLHKYCRSKKKTLCKQMVV